jgi:hypothetical protein
VSDAPQPQPLEVEETHRSELRTRRSVLTALGGSGVAALAATMLIPDPSSAAPISTPTGLPLGPDQLPKAPPLIVPDGDIDTYQMDVGPNFIRVVDVTYFGALGDGKHNDTEAIVNAINYARTRKLEASKTGTWQDVGGGTRPLPVYFPAGLYLIDSPLTVDGVRLIGEPATIAAGSPGAVGTRTCIKAMDSFSGDRAYAANPKSNAILPEPFEGSPMLVTKTHASGDLHIYGLLLDGSDKADYGLALLGANNSVIDNLEVWSVRLDGIVVDASAARLTNVRTTHGIGRHGLRALNANGLELDHFYFWYGKTHAEGSALLLEGHISTPSSPKGDGGACYVTNGSTLPIAVRTDVEEAPVVHCRNLDYGVIRGVYIEGGNTRDIIKLEGTQLATVENCRMSSSSTGQHSSGADACCIHLSSWEGILPNGQKQFRGSSTNAIRGNIGLTGLKTTGTVATYETRWDFEEQSAYQARIRIDDGCFNNHITDNRRMHGNGSEMEVWYPGSKTQSGRSQVDTPRVPNVRTHTVGQQHVITYASRAPLPDTITGTTDPVHALAGRWHQGDIVFNSEPACGEPIGWVFVDDDKGVKKFLPFGQVWDPNDATCGASSAHDSSLTATKRPKTGIFQRGTVIYNSHPKVGRPVGWVCTRAGTPAQTPRFRAFGRIYRT